jgi:hypothetical protein
MGTTSPSVESLIEQYASCMLAEHGWIDMHKLWDELRAVGERRDLQKRSYQSTKNWSRSSTHFLGLVGEAAISVITGIPINEDLDPRGDGCLDFGWEGIFIDVKGTTYWRNPHLKQYPDPKKWCDIYILVGIDEGAKRAKVSGWATGAEVQTATLVDYGHGPQRSIPHNLLHAGLPSILPRRKILL